MSIIEYLKEKLPFLLINFILFILLSVVMLMVGVGEALIFLVFCIWFLPLFMYIGIELTKHKKYYDKLNKILDSLNKKYLLPEVIGEPSFVDGKIIYQILSEVSREMHEHVKFYKDKEWEYREYIETWVHEVKTPIASTKLIIENNCNPITDRIKTQLSSIEGFVEQALYYSRSEDVNKDYIIKCFELDQVVKSVIKRNSRDFIMKRIKLKIGDINRTIYSDCKWVEFIINQILGNAIKYSQENDSQINIFTVMKDNSIVLTIQDNGVGIIEKDINRVFEKGFTGENGRIFGKSTGIGLYLCHSLCIKLGLGLSLYSKVGEGTRVNIVFPQGQLPV